MQKIILPSQYEDITPCLKMVSVLLFKAALTHGDIIGADFFPDLEELSNFSSDMLSVSLCEAVGNSPSEDFRAWQVMCRCGQNIVGPTDQNSRPKKHFSSRCPFKAPSVAAKAKAKQQPKRHHLWLQKQRP